MGIGLDTPRHSANAGSFIFKVLSSDGAGGGTYNWVGDHTPATASYMCPADNIATIHRMLITIADVGGIGVLNYGALAELTNGLHLVAYDTDGTTELLHLDGEHPIKTNADWGSFCYDVDFRDEGAGNAGYVNARWTFDKAGRPIVLKAGQSLAILLNDDFTGLDHHHFMIQGYTTKVFNKGT